MFCREQAVQVHRERGAIQAKGAELHLIGNGNPHQAEGFATTFGLTCPIWVDTSLDTFRALEMKQGFFATMGTPATWKAGLRAWGRGFRQGMTQGNAWQLGGVLVVRPEGEVLYRYRSAFAGDHPPVAAVGSSYKPSL